VATRDAFYRREKCIIMMGFLQGCFVIKRHEREVSFGLPTSNTTFAHGTLRNSQDR
jgi:hypothetical protein